MTELSPPLALKYRPTQFPDLVGQRLNALVLHRMVETDSVPPALLFSGPSGVGKTTAARVLASQMGASDTIEVDAASNGGVDQIRKLLEVARYSTGGAHRVLVLDEAHSITRQGFEALLKTLEEPPAQTVFVLVTTEPHKIPGTVLSRLVEFQFRSIPDNDVLDRLVLVAQKEAIEADLALLHHIAQRANGNVRSALMSLDQVSRAGIETLSAYRELVGEHDPAPALLEAAASGDHAAVFEALDSLLASVGGPGRIISDLVSCLRDLLVLKSGGSLRVTGPAYESRRQLATRLESERFLTALRVLWELRTKLREDDPRGSLELALVLITEAFTAGREIVRTPAKTANASSNGVPPAHLPPPQQVSLPEPAPEEKRMSFSDLQRLAAKVG